MGAALVQPDSETEDVQTGMTRGRRTFPSPLWAWALVAVGWACVILASNTLVGCFLLPNALLGEGAAAASILIALVLAAGLWVGHPVRRTTLHRWLAWAAFVAVVYCICWFAHAQAGGHALILWAAGLAVFPLALALLRERGMLDGALRVFTTEVTVLTAVSILLWYLGPIKWWIQPDCTIESTWSIPEGATTYGYHWLLFMTQWSHVGGADIARNTGIFVEGPMYSYVLCAALLIETCLVRRPCKIVVAILLATIATTLTTTGYLIALWVLAAGMVVPLVRRRWEAAAGSSARRGLIGALVGLALVAAALAVAYLLRNKLGSVSGSDRADVLRAGWLAWLQSPMLGNGLSAERAIAVLRTLYPGSAAFSNSLTVVPALGGIVFCLLYLVPLGGLLARRSWRTTVYALGILGMWAVTLAYNMVLTAVLFCLGAVALICGDAEDGQGEKDAQDERDAGKARGAHAKPAEAVTFAAGLRFMGRRWLPIIAACGASVLLVLVLNPLLPHAYSLTTTLTVADEPAVNAADGTPALDAAGQPQTAAAVTLDLGAMLERDEYEMAAIGQTPDRLYGRYSFGVAVDPEARTASLYVEGPSAASVTAVAQAVSDSAVGQYQVAYAAPTLEAPAVTPDQAAPIDDRALYAAAALLAALLATLAVLTREHA